MKKTVLFLAAISLVFASTEEKSKKPEKTIVQAPVKVLVTDVDSMSYAIGLNVGSDFSKNLKGIPGGKSNIDLLIKGFTTAMRGDSALMKPEVAMEFFKSYIAKASGKDAELKKGAGEKFSAKNFSPAPFFNTASFPDAFAI